MTENKKRVPRSGYDQTKGLTYFARMLDKTRLFAADELREDFRANVGIKMDARMCDFLRVPYESLRVQVLEGGSDENILDWCLKNGRHLSDFDIFVWNAFVTKFGWKDEASSRLHQLKSENGLTGRDDIATFFQFFEVDEGRAS